MSTKTTHNDAAVARMIATIDNAVADLYPNHTCFIAAANPEHGVMVTRALFEGSPVALIFEDGHEILLIPRTTHSDRSAAPSSASSSWACAGRAQTSSNSPAQHPHRGARVLPHAGRGLTPRNRSKRLEPHGVGAYGQLTRPAERARHRACCRIDRGLFSWRRDQSRQARHLGRRRRCRVRRLPSERDLGPVTSQARVRVSLRADRLTRPLWRRFGQAGANLSASARSSN